MVKIKLLHKCNLAFLLCLAVGALSNPIVYAQKTECAEVKIVIEQKLAFERQAFDAKMIISNGLSTTTINNIGVELQFLDKDGQTVLATLNPNDTNAQFFYRTDTLSGIQAIDGTGNIPAKSSAEIHWLIIPSKNAVSNIDELYYVGAKVNYHLNDIPTTVEVTPDYIVVRPLPELTLDYFLPKDVYGDDPLTVGTEPAVPFTLGVRVKNSGYGPAYNASIESAQPKIVSNDQNLLVNYEILGSFVDNAIVDKSLNVHFGDIMPGSSKIGRWQMVSSLSGEFTDFNATYTHADALGGATTSLIKDIKTHTLIHDVKLPYRDDIRDFLVLDDDGLRVYDSEGNDEAVLDVSAQSRVELVNNTVKIIKSPTPGALFYLKVKDPFNGQKKLAQVVTSMPNPSPLLPENYWLSKERNSDQSWSHYINIFYGPTSSTSYEAIFTDINVQGRISGKVFYDQNNNGLPDVSDLGVALAPVVLTGVDDQGLNIKATAYADQNGEFVFNNLNTGVYNLGVGAVNGVLDGTAFVGGMDGRAEPGSVKNINLFAGQHSSGNTFAKLDSNAAKKFPGSAELTVGIPMISPSTPPKVGQKFSVYLGVQNNGPDLAKDSVISFKVPDNVEVVGIQKGYSIDAAGIIQLGDLPSNPKKAIPIRIDLKILNDQAASLVAKVSSRNEKVDSKMKVYSISVVPNTSK